VQQVNLPEVRENGSIKKQIRMQKQNSFCVFGGKGKDLYVKLTFSYFCCIKNSKRQKYFQSGKRCLQQ